MFPWWSSIGCPLVTEDPFLGRTVKIPSARRASGAESSANWRPLSSSLPHSHHNSDLHFHRDRSRPRRGLSFGSLVIPKRRPAKKKHAREHKYSLHAKVSTDKTSADIIELRTIRVVYDA